MESQIVSQLVSQLNNNRANNLEEVVVQLDEQSLPQDAVRSVSFNPQQPVKISPVIKEGPRLAQKQVQLKAPAVQEVPKNETVTVNIVEQNADYYSIFGFQLSKTTIYIAITFILLIVIYYCYKYFRGNDTTSKSSTRKPEVTFDQQESKDKDRDKDKDKDKDD